MLKLFRITSSEGKDYVAATTIIHALKVYCQEFRCEIKDFNDDEQIAEVPIPATKRMKIQYSGGKIRVYDFLKLNIKACVINKSFT